MKTEQMHWSNRDGWQQVDYQSSPAAGAQLVFVFGATARLRDQSALEQLQSRYPHAQLFGCSTSGEIAGTRVFDDTIVATALEFTSTPVRIVKTPIVDKRDSREAGRRLAEQLSPDGLSHVLVLTDGLKVNGSQLVEGLEGSLPSTVAVTGGLAGDGTRFNETLVVSSGPGTAHVASAVGLYGSRVRVGYASLGGWDPFGPERLITKSAGNVLFELDGQSALALYKRYLGEHAADLPASGLLFPLALRHADDDEPIVRTILSIDESEQSLTFAGDVPVGARARLMKANIDRLIDGATGAARGSHQGVGSAHPDFALLISCVGRRLVLKQRTEEELEAVRDVLGPHAAITGFYSYGEISPFTPSARSQLHNQTMTVTTVSEH